MCLLLSAAAVEKLREFRPLLSLKINGRTKGIFHTWEIFNARTASVHKVSHQFYAAEREEWSSSAVAFSAMNHFSYVYEKGKFLYSRLLLGVRKQQLTFLLTHHIHSLGWGVNQKADFLSIVVVHIGKHQQKSWPNTNKSLVKAGLPIYKHFFLPHPPLKV